MPTIKDALDIIGKLTVAEQESLKTMLLSPAFVKSLNIEDFVAKERFANGRVCPLCGCIHVVRNGHRKDGTQRYVCKDCGKSFVIATNSIVSGTRKDLSVWEQYIDCMMNGLSIRKTAVACGIHRNTAFLWRHKILDALQNMADDVTLDGIIEADETFFAISYKGNHSKSKTFAMPRKAHKRGHSTHIRGLSQEKVCVPCAVNRNGLSISKITNTGRVSTKDLHHIYDGRKVFYLDAIDVMPDYQGKGYGTGLISFARDYAKTIDCYKMYLITNRSNISACKCYEKAGGINKVDDEIIYVYDFKEKN